MRDSEGVLVEPHTILLVTSSEPCRERRALFFLLSFERKIREAILSPVSLIGNRTLGGS